MEERDIELAEFEKERIKAMESRNEVYLCSGGQIHNHGCDGECGVRVLDPAEIAINDEHTRWEELGMVPMGGLPQLPGIPGVPVNTLKLEVAMAALTQMLYEVTDLDKDALNDKFRELYLDRITSIRETNQEAMIEARRRMNIAAPGADIVPQLIVPDHIKRKQDMH